MFRHNFNANKILKTYGKAMFDSHVTYMDDATNDTPLAPSPSVPRRRFSFRRVAIVCLVLILCFAMAMVVCDALGIQIFNFNFDQKKDHAVLTSKNTQDGEKYYKPSFIVKGYHLDDVIDTGSALRDYSYEKGDSNVYYTVSETTSTKTRLYIDTEGYDHEKIVHGEYDVRLYKDQHSPLVIAYLQKDNTYISIQGKLSEDDVFKIIDSLKSD